MKQVDAISGNNSKIDRGILYLKVLDSSIKN